jgi:hypothetical protein
MLMNRKVRYKVVRKKGRGSAIVHGNSKYCLTYNPGAVVKALPNTLGIFVFKHKTYAQDWCNSLNSGKTYINS